MLRFTHSTFTPPWNVGFWVVVVGYGCGHEGRRPSPPRPATRGHWSDAQTLGCGTRTNLDLSPDSASHCQLCSQEGVIRNPSLSFLIYKLGLMINSLLLGELCETPLSQEIKCSVNCERSVLGKGLSLDQGSSTLGMPQLQGYLKATLNPGKMPRLAIPPRNGQ